jgi:hypothetical protein
MLGLFSENNEVLYTKSSLNIKGSFSYLTIFNITWVALRFQRIFSF